MTEATEPHLQLVAARAAERARRVSLAVVLVAVLTGVFYGLGWAAGRAWFCVAWAGCAIAEGFTAGAHPDRGQPPG